MSASDHLNNVQFSTAHQEWGGVQMGSTYAHNGPAMHNGSRNLSNIVGVLQWGMEHPDGEGPSIDKVWVHPAMRRAGVATAMLGAARSAGGVVNHSPARTDAGEAWARAQGAAPRARKGSWKSLADTYPE